MRSWIAAGLLAAAAPGQATMTDAFCIDLRRIVAAAGERPPFASLASGRRPSLGLAASCGAGDPASGTVYYCDRLERN